ncbi:peptide ABC transporter substrate-binding protein [Enterococcus sp. LJL99]
MKKILLATSLSVVLLVTAACGSSSNNAEEEAKDQVKQILKRVENAELPTADLSLATDAVSLTALYNTYEGLYRLGDSDELLPAGATELAEISNDGLKYTVKLNEKAKWSDGRSVTANDYVFSWQRTVDPQTGSEYAEMFKPVRNAEKIIEGEIAKEELGIKALSDYELEIELESATPYFQNLLAFPNFFPQRKDIVEKYGKEYATTSENAVYNGAFVLEDYIGPGVSSNWKYVKNNTYWDKEAVKLNEVDIKVVKEANTALNMYEDGKINETYLSGELAQQNLDNPDFLSILQPNTFYIQFNMNAEDSILKNENVRKAISYSIDRKAIADKILANGSTAAETYVPAELAYSPESHEDFTKYSQPKATFDKEKSKESWEKALKELGEDSIELELLVTDTESAKKISEYLQEELQQTLTGIKINVSSVPFAVSLDRLDSGSYDIALAGMGADYPDPMSYLNNLESSNPLNYGGFINGNYDTLINEINTKDGANLDLRWNKMVEANQIIMNELPITPVFQQAKTYLRNSTVKGVESHAMGAPFDYKNAEITK